MKKLQNLVIAFLFATVILVSACAGTKDEQHSGSISAEEKSNVNPRQLFMHMDSFPIAKVTKETVTKKVAGNLPVTQIYMLDSDNISGAIMMSLPSLVDFYSMDTLPMLPHGNITLLNYSGQVFGIMPKHMFRTKNLHEVLKSSNIFSEEHGDIVTTKLKEIQKPITCEPFNYLDPSVLDGVSCTINSLNSFSGEPIYDYEIRGVLKYLEEEEINYLLRDAKSLEHPAQKVDKTKRTGQYVVRVPDSLFSQVPGMSGGAVTVIINGKERFLGVNNERMFYEVKIGKDTLRATLMAIQPVLKSDLE